MADEKAVGSSHGFDKPRAISVPVKKVKDSEGNLWPYLDPCVTYIRSDATILGRVNLVDEEVMDNCSNQLIAKVGEVAPKGFPGAVMNVLKLYTPESGLIYIKEDDKEWTDIISICCGPVTRS